MRFLSVDMLNPSAGETEVPFESYTFSNVASPAPGGFSCSIDSAHPLATRDTLAQKRHAIYFDDDSKSTGSILRSGGLIWNRRKSADLKTLTVGGQGIWSYFHGSEAKGRALADPFAGTGDQFDLAALLIALGQDSAGENIGLTMRPHPAHSGVTRTAAFKRTDLKQFSQILEDWASADDGFDFNVTPQWVSGQIKLFLDLWYPERGIVREDVWEIGASIVLDEDWVEDTGANRIFGVGGATSGAPLISVAADPPTDQLRVDAVVSFPDVTSQAELDSLTRGERKRQRSPQGVFTVRVTNSDVINLDTFDVSDTIQFKADMGDEQLYQPARVQGYTVTGDENGAETLKVDLVLA